MGYDSLTWKPAKFASGLRAVDEFHQRYPEKPGPVENALGGRRPQGGDIVTVLEYTEILQYNGRKPVMVWKDLCYGRAETLGDAEEAARWWWDSLF